MKKRLVLAISATLLTAAVGVGASLALFTDTAASDNTVTAGHVCITSRRDAGDNFPGPMFYMTGAQGSPNGGVTPGRLPTGEVSSTSPAWHTPETVGGWAPGDEVLRTLDVYNGGDGCPGSVLEVNLVAVSAELTASSYAPLADKMLVTVYAQGAGMEQVAQAYLSDFLAPGGVELSYPGGHYPNLPNFSGAVMQMQFVVRFDLDTPNEYQDKEMVVHFTVHAQQAANTPPGP